MNCSSNPLKKRNAQIAAGALLITMAVFLLFNLTVLAVYSSDLFSHPMYPYMILNSLLMALVGMSLGFLFGTLSKHDGHISVFGVSTSMVLSFLGGVFVPLSVISKEVLVVSRLLPTYWYMTVLEKLCGSTSMTGSTRELFTQGILIQLAFALAVIGVTLVISRKRMAAVQAA